MEKIKTTKAVVVTEKPSEVDTFISQAISANAPIETMERLFDLRIKVKAEKAKEEFVKALSSFQEDCPVIVKTKKVMNKDGQTVRYQFAPLDAIAEQIKKPLKDNGLYYSWTVKNEPTQITAIATLTHVLGHSESSEFTIPVVKSEFMTAPQGFAAALTFAKRYSLLNVTGISTADEDTDATSVNKEKTAKSDKSKIIFCLKTLGFESRVKEEIENKIYSLTKLPLEDKNFSEIVSRLEIIIAEKNENSKV